MPKDTFQSERCAVMLKALSEPIRLRMADVLRSGPKNVGELAELLDIELVNASHHLGVLTQAGLTERRRDGRHILYGLAQGVLAPPKTKHRLCHN